MRTVIPLTLMAFALLSLRAPGQTAPATAAGKPNGPESSQLQAQSSGVSGSRIVKTFDFQEKPLGNFESIPMFWSKVSGHGFPAYCTGAFDSTVFRSPGVSFKLGIDGGSSAFQYAPGKLPINPAADYYVLAYVKTTPLKHARAQISAWFADADGKLIDPAQVHFDSEAYAATKAPADQEWRLLHIYVPGPAAGTPAAAAKSLVLQVGLLQPRQLADPAAPSDLGKFALYQQDIKGAAWFDDITVFQLPRVSIATPETVAANIFPPGQKVELNLAISDIAAANHAAANVPADAAVSPPLAASLNLTDPDGLLFASEKFTVTATDKTPWTHRYVHDSLPPGLYTATLDVSDRGALIARRQTRFLSLAPAFSILHKGPAEFGFTVRDGPQAPELLARIPYILRYTGANLLQMPAWRKDLSEDALLRRDVPLDSLFAALQRMDVHVAASFSEMPTALSARIAEARAKTSAAAAPIEISRLPPPAPDTVLALEDSDPALWRPYVSFLLARYGSRVDAWEYGSLANPYSGSLPPDDSPESSVHATGADPRYPQLYARGAGELAALVHHPRVLIPWNALFEFDAKLYPDASGMDLELPAAIRPNQIPAYIDNFKQALSLSRPAISGGSVAPPSPAPTSPTTPSLTPAASASASLAAVLFAHIEPLDPRHYARADRLVDFAQRVVYARTANPSGILIDLPVSAGLSGSTGSRPEPDELLLVYRTLIHAMSGSRYLREVAFTPGVKAFLFDREGMGTMILWNESAPQARMHLDLPLGTSPRIIDLAGNVRPLGVDRVGGLSGVDVTSTPVILDHLDSKALMLRASFSLASSTFPAGAGSVSTQLLLNNPYDDLLVGDLKLTLPKGWTMEPISVPVALAPGASIHQPITLHYPFSERAGAYAVQAQLKTDGGQKFDFSCPVAITSDLVELDSSAQLLPNGDLVVQQVITNISAAPISAQAYTMVPGYPRQQRYLLGLNPGQTTIKRFIFPLSTFDNATKQTQPADIAAALAGKTAAVGLRENDGRTLITKSLPLQ
jgi:hypothetical protein